MKQWIIGGGIAGNTCDHGRLGEVQLHRGGFARFILQPEVDGGCGINTISLVAVIDAVEIHFQDVVFCIETVDLRGQHDLFEFAYI